MNTWYRKVSCFLLIYLLQLAEPVFAGPFVATGNSTAKSVNATYRKSIKVSSDQITKLSAEVAKQSEATSKNTYKHSTRPTADATTKVSDQTVPVTTEAMDASTRATDRSTEATTKATEKSSEVTEPMTQVTYDHSTKPTGEFTTRASETSSEVTEKASHQTEKALEQSTKVTDPILQATYNKSVKPTGEFTTKTSETSSEVSAETAETTPRVVRSTADATTKGVEIVGQVSHQTSIKLDATLADTLKSIWKDYQAWIIDPDTADKLVKEAYAFSGSTLAYFAEALKVSPDLLAHTIVSRFPQKATRTQLQQIMTYIIPGIEASILKNVES